MIVGVDEASVDKKRVIKTLLDYLIVIFSLANNFVLPSYKSTSKVVGVIAPYLSFVDKT